MKGKTDCVCSCFINILSLDKFLDDYIIIHVQFSI